jgi:flagellar basal-body rod modification protein FlgD
MQLTPATSTPTATGSTPGAATASTTASTSTVSTQDFMQLLSTEMANQDPMQPMDPTQTMTQLAQFSNLQQTTTLAQTQGLAAANSFLGTQVTLPGTNGAAPFTGTVVGIDSSAVAAGGMPSLIVNGATTEYPLTDVSQVTIPAAAGSSSSSPSTSTSASATTQTPTQQAESAAVSIGSQVASQILQ